MIKFFARMWFSIRMFWESLMLEIDPSREQQDDQPWPGADREHADLTQEELVRTMRLNLNLPICAPPKDPNQQWHKHNVTERELAQYDFNTYD